MGRNTEPLVSVIIPTYDRPDLLRDAVESVLDQTYTNIELLVVDDNSPTPAKRSLSFTSSSEIKSIRIIQHEENKGANVARNTGIKNANGDFIAFLDDDDKWKPTKIEQQITTFQEGGDLVGVVSTGQRFIDDSGTTTSIHISEITGDVTKQLLVGASMATFSSIMVRSSAIQKAGLPDERFPSWQDREWYVRLSQYCEFESIPEPLVIRHIGDHDRIADNYIQKRDISYPLFLEKHQSLAAEYGLICKQRMKQSLRSELGKHALRQGKYQEAQRQLTKSILNYPLVLKTYAYLLIALTGKPGHKIAKKYKTMYEKYKFLNANL